MHGALWFVLAFLALIVFTSAADTSAALENIARRMYDIEQQIESLKSRVWQLEKAREQEQRRNR